MHCGVSRQIWGEGMVSASSADVADIHTFDPRGINLTATISPSASSASMHVPKLPEPSSFTCKPEIEPSRTWRQANRRVN